MQLGGGTFEMGDGDGGATITVEVSNSRPQEFSRRAADLRRFGKDRFVIQVLPLFDDGAAQSSSWHATMNHCTSTACQVIAL